MRYVRNSLVVGVLGFLAVFSTGDLARRAAADPVVVEFETGQDNTLYDYDPLKFEPEDQDPQHKSWNKSNGRGDFFSAGRTFGKNQIQRGLIRFDFDPALVPAGMVVESASLELFVVDSPKRDTTPRDFWLVALPELPQPWGEGGSDVDAGVSGAGSGADPQAPDATWYHTQYDPASTDHYDPDDLLPNSPWVYDASKPGFWSQPGALGDNAFVLPGSNEPEGVDVGLKGSTTVWSTSQMAADVQRWLDDPAGNFGWVVLGNESVVNYTDPDTGQLVEQSSKRGFASFDHGNDTLRPVLRVTFDTPSVVVPEPSTLLLALIAAIGLGASVFARTTHS